MYNDLLLAIENYYSQEKNSIESLTIFLIGAHKISDKPTLSVRPMNGIIVLFTIIVF